MLVYVAGALVAVLLAACFTVFFARIIESRNRFRFDADWLQAFTLDRYKPMHRLLDDRDYQFLEAQPGYDRRIGQNLRRQRIAVFRAYLSELSLDVDRLHWMGRLVVIAGAGSPELSDELFRSKLRFTKALWLVRWRLCLYQVGLSNVDVSELLGGVDRLCVAVRVPALVSAA
jgi:hypothetical protein